MSNCHVNIISTNYDFKVYKQYIQFLMSNDICINDMHSSTHYLSHAQITKTMPHYTRMHACLHTQVH